MNGHSAAAAAVAQGLLMDSARESPSSSGVNRASPSLRSRGSQASASGRSWSSFLSLDNLFDPAAPANGTSQTCLLRRELLRRLLHSHAESVGDVVLPDYLWDTTPDLADMSWEQLLQEAKLDDESGDLRLLARISAQLRQGKPATHIANEVWYMAQHAMWDANSEKAGNGQGPWSIVEGLLGNRDGKRRRCQKAGGVLNDKTAAAD